MGWKYYRMIYQPNVTLKGKETTYLYVPTGARLQQVVNLLYEQNYIINRNSFEWVARKMSYEGNNVVPGKYLLKENMNNRQLIKTLRQGRGSLEVEVTYSNARTPAELAGYLARNIEADSLDFIALLTDEEIASRYGFSRQAFLTMFIPNTYKLYWNTSAEDLLERMAAEYKKFWTEERKAQAHELGLSQSEVATLASIVQSETHRVKEMPTVAGVYLNRIRKGMLLQADPTVVYAVGDFTINRVLNVHKEVDSPYNTYKYPGLPPGPICLPMQIALEAVLRAEKHDYLYFCAKEDFSGYHNFAKTYNQHLQNARRYQQALNNRGIMQ